MPYVLVEDFKGGIDTRRTVITSVPGTAITLTNAHITRGGEIEKRRAFKLWATLPANNTKGLAAGGGRVYVFGDDSVTLSSSLPPSLSYIRFQHPAYSTGNEPMKKVLGWDFFDGNVYASILFDDGSIYHYWDGYSNTNTTPNNRIDDWIEGRSRGWIKINTGSLTSATGDKATSTFTIDSGTNIPGNNLRTLRVNNVDIISSPVAHTGDNDTAAAAIALAINNTTSTPNYTGSSSNNSVTITSDTRGTGPNGFAVVGELEGDFDINCGAGGSSISALSGGVDNAITDITVGGKSIIANPILWETSNEYTATKVAEEINSTFTDPEWEATTGTGSSTNAINVIAKEPGSTYNLALAVTKTGVLDESNNVENLSATVGGGTLATGYYLGGGFVRAFDNQMHALSDDRWHNCGLDSNGNGTPDYWTAGSNNAGFRTLSNHSRGAEELVAIAPYFENLAVFGLDVIQIWKSDPDPDNYSRVQILNNTGTLSGKSVTEIGDSDVFYLSRSGIRSLRARDSSNSAHVGDIGNPIDTIILEAIAADPEGARSAVGIVDPRDGRYLLALGAKVYVFSYFPSSKISAWSVYEHGFTDANGDVEPITDWAFDGTELLCRAGDKIYSLGGKLNNEYDSSVVTVQLPFLDAGKPATNKMWTGLDAVCSSDWVVSVGTDPTDITQYETAATINKATYGMGRVSLSSTSTHLALRMVNSKDGAATLGNCAVHYELNEAG